MALKVLGQAAPAATTLVDIYTVPAQTEVVSSTVSVCNRSGGEVRFRIAIRPGGAALENKHYVAYGSPVAGNDTTFITVGFTLAASDVISVYAENDQLSFSVFGNEA